MLGDEQYAIYLHYLRNPKLSAEATATMTRRIATSLRHRVLEKFVTKGSKSNHIYRIASHPQYPRITANLHSQLNHQGINKVHSRIMKVWFGIIEPNLKRVLNECAVCTLSKWRGRGRKKDLEDTPSRLTDRICNGNQQLGRLPV